MSVRVRLHELESRIVEKNKIKKTCFHLFPSWDPEDLQSCLPEFVRMELVHLKAMGHNKCCTK